MWNMVHGLAKKDDVKFLRGRVSEEVRTHETILVRSAVFRCSLHGFGQGRLRNVHANVTPVYVCGQFIRRVARTAAEV